MKTGLFTDVPGNIVSFLDQKGISCRTFFGFEKTLRFTERHFLPGEALFVMGTCQESGQDPESPPEGALPNICLAKGDRSEDVFFLSDESQKQLESSFGTKAFFGVFGGIALVGACLWELFSLLG
jgi:hypothetical protein